MPLIWTNLFFATFKRVLDWTNIIWGGDFYILLVFKVTYMWTKRSLAKLLTLHETFLLISYISNYDSNKHKFEKIEWAHVLCAFLLSGRSFLCTLKAYWNKTLRMHPRSLEKYRWDMKYYKFFSNLPYATNKNDLLKDSFYQNA